MSRQRLLQQRRRSTASALALALLLAGLALPASAQAENLPDPATSVGTAPEGPVDTVPGASQETTPPEEQSPSPDPGAGGGEPTTEPVPDPAPEETTAPPVEGIPDEDPSSEPVPVPGTGAGSPGTGGNETPATGGGNSSPGTGGGSTGGGSTGGGSTGGGSTGGGSTGGGSTGGGSTGGGSTGGGSTGGGSTGGGSTGGGSTGGGSTGGSNSGSTGGGSGSAGGTTTTEAGATPPRASAPGRTLLSTSAADPAAAPVPGTETAGAPAVSVFLTRDAGVDPGALTVDLARFYGVGIAYAGFQREENATATLKAPAGTETPLTIENRQDGETTSTGSATVPTAALLSIGTYTITVSGDRGSSATTTFALIASSAPGILVEPREASSSEAATPRGAVWGFGPVESVTVGAFTTAGVKADLAAGDLSVRVDALGWSDLDLGDAIVAEPTAEVYCLVAVGSVSKRTAAVTVAYPEEGSTATAPDAAQVCGIAITTAKAGTVPPAAASTGGLSAGVGLTIGAGVLVALLIAGLVTAVVLRRRRENDDLLIGGPLPHPTEQ
ncbi:hypothetical protein [Rathayibacter sp. VKM Ac-2857]|uniref:hypothetical protein n=1 Tax=Rathayibacter sp. VKM Ac-2857 TaxID=2739020 RepID=UPI0015651356|nr:hypothetical protein [Rathayibacter sp. VKM Ac-2857]NQX16327.1 hypothetical protein [Rathayibacter sp. VKM Ac-2857]